MKKKGEYLIKRDNYEDSELLLKKSQSVELQLESVKRSQIKQEMILKTFLSAVFFFEPCLDQRKYQWFGFPLSTFKTRFPKVSLFLECMFKKMGFVDLGSKTVKDLVISFQQQVPPKTKEEKIKKVQTILVNLVNAKYEKTPLKKISEIKKKNWKKWIKYLRTKHLDIIKSPKVKDFFDFPSSQNDHLEKIKTFYPSFKRETESQIQKIIKQFFKIKKQRKKFVFEQSIENFKNNNKFPWSICMLKCSIQFLKEYFLKKIKNNEKL